jgi:hypothetical protein
VKRSTAGEKRRPHHAVRATDDREGAEGSLVHIAPAAQEHHRALRRECLPGEQVARHGFGRFGFEPQRMHRHRSAEVDAVARQQSGLHRNESRRRCRTDRDAMRDAGVGVDAAWHIERENRDAGRIRVFDVRRILRRKRTGKADAEQPVDDERSAPVRRKVRQRRSTSVDKGPKRTRRVDRKPCRLATEYDDDIEERFAKPPRDNESVAAVVPRPREDEDRSAAVAEHRACHVGGRLSRPLHQRLPACRRFHPAQLPRAENGKEIHSVHYRTPVESRPPVLPPMPPRSRPAWTSPPVAAKLCALSPLARLRPAPCTRAARKRGAQK